MRPSTTSTADVIQNQPARHLRGNISTPVTGGMGTALVEMSG